VLQLKGGGRGSVIFGGGDCRSKKPLPFLDYLYEPGGSIKKKNKRLFVELGKCFVILTAADLKTHSSRAVMGEREDLVY